MAGPDNSKSLDKGRPVRYRYLSGMITDYLTLGFSTQADKWLSNELKQHREFGKNDRAWYADHFFGWFRRMVPITWLLSDLSIADFHESFNHPDKYKDFWLSSRQDLLSNYLDKTDDEFRHLVTNKVKDDLIPTALLIAGFPGWFTSHLQTRLKSSDWSDETSLSFISSFSRPADLFIRYNYPEKAMEVKSELIDNGFKIKELENGLMISGDTSLHQLTLFKKGWIDIQDYASQQIGLDTDVHPGQMVWDACAGGGGKTMQLAALMNQKGTVYASDNREWKLEDTKKRARRAQFSTIRFAPWDGHELPSFSREIQKRGGFHRVLVDAPCSNTGTWKRNPDARFRPDVVDNMEDLLDLQFQILQAASKGVRANGHLIYATCSWRVDENEEMVNRFLNNNPRFELVRQKLHFFADLETDVTFSAVMRMSNN